MTINMVHRDSIVCLSMYLWDLGPAWYKVHRRANLPGKKCKFSFGYLIISFKNLYLIHIWLTGKQNKTNRYLGENIKEKCQYGEKDADSLTTKPKQLLEVNNLFFFNFWKIITWVLDIQALWRYQTRGRQAQKTLKKKREKIDSQTRKSQWHMQNAVWFYHPRIIRMNMAFIS